jgi:adenosine deaminase
MALERACEMQGPRSVWDAIELGVDRVAHGVRAIEDAALVERLSRCAVTLDVCPGSNLALGLYRDMAGHPLRRLFDAGVRVTLSSDDPLYFNTSARGEYERAARQGFSRAELMRISGMAIEASFASSDLRPRLHARLARGPETVLAELP